MFNSESFILPWCGRRYIITNIGKVLDINGNEITSFLKEGNRYVNISWINGNEDYLVSILILVAFNKIKIPDYLLKEVEPLYIDGNVNNLCPSNLIYRYKNGPLEVEEYKGYYYIPMYNDYAITRNGDIINIKTGKTKVWSISQAIAGDTKNKKQGYLYTRVIEDSGISKILFQHRALCLVFLPYDNTVLSKVVNHKDGIPDNNILDNLEWVTYKENNLHALNNGLRPNSTIPVIMKDLKTDKEIRFVSLSACARYLSPDTDKRKYVTRRIENSNKKIYADMLLFKYDDGTQFPKINLDDLNMSRHGIATDIAARNIFTGDVIIFKGINEGYKITGVKPATILRHVRENSDIPINGYNFRYLDFSDEWPIHSEKHLKIYKDNPVYPSNGIELINKDTGECIEFFTSSVAFCQKFKISKQILSYLINKQMVFKQNYIVKFFSIK